jgi:hypothetical protein
VNELAIGVTPAAQSPSCAQDPVLGRLRMLFPLFGSIVILAGCGSTHRANSARAYSIDPPILVPWTRIGDLALGESKAQVQRQYDRTGRRYHITERYRNSVTGYYNLHHSKVTVSFYGRNVSELMFSTPYYRTRHGFGVGSKIPLGQCQKSLMRGCVHRWRGFVYNAWSTNRPCNCWVKVGRGMTSLPATVANFQKPWFFIYVRRGRVARFYFSLRFVD